MKGRVTTVEDAMYIRIFLIFIDGFRARGQVLTLLVSFATPGQTIILLLISELAMKRATMDEVTQGFGELAEKEWGAPGVAFVEEMDVFLSRVKRAEDRMSSENVIKMMGFVALLMVGVRLVIFMKVHPRVATITRTFETVGTELLNFLFSFGIIFIFMALTAHLRYAPHPSIASRDLPALQRRDARL
jgi:hypothetical protein